MTYRRSRSNTRLCGALSRSRRERRRLVRNICVQTVQNIEAVRIPLNQFKRVVVVWQRLECAVFLPLLILREKQLCCTTSWVLKLPLSCPKDYDIQILLLVRLDLLLDVPNLIRSLKRKPLSSFPIESGSLTLKSTKANVKLFFVAEQSVVYLVGDDHGLFRTLGWKHHTKIVCTHSIVQ